MFSGWWQCYFEAVTVGWGFFGTLLETGLKQNKDVHDASDVVDFSEEAERLRRAHDKKVTLAP